MKKPTYQIPRSIYILFVITILANIVAMYVMIKYFLLSQ